MVRYNYAIVFTLVNENMTQFHQSISTPRYAVLLATAMAGNLALAQTPPDAGALRQQIERERPSTLPRQAVPAKPADPPAMRPGGVSITVKQFRFAGNTLIDSEKLAPVVASYLGRPLDFNQLSAAATAVANAYREAGWVVRVYLPQQDIQDGIVTIQIVEAVFGILRQEGDSPTRIAGAHVTGLFQAQQTSGQPLNTDALDRALLLADDLPGVTVSGTLRPGQGLGQTDLMIKLADEPPLVGEAIFDNTGSRSTGDQRLAANFAFASPFGMGDLLSANLIHTRGSDFLRLAYTLPVGHDGLRVGMNISHLGYTLVAAEFRALNASGKSDTVGLEASYPIIRSRLKNLYFSAAYDRKRFDNTSSGATTTRYDVDALTLGLAGNLFDQFGGGGANSASLALTRGNLDLDGSPNKVADATTARTHGSFSKLRYAASRQQVVTESVSLYAAISGQEASKNLDSSEKFYLGGANGVRAYPSNEAGGSKGQMLNAELRWRLPENFTTVAFVDWGRVSQNVDTGFTGAATPNTYSLKGHGVSLAWQAAFGLNLKATWARRDGVNPNRDALTGRDQDGSLDKNRWWFNATLPF